MKLLHEVLAIGLSEIIVGNQLADNRLPLLITDSLHEVLETMIQGFFLR